MRRTAVLIAALTLAVSGCGSSSTTTPRAQSTATPAGHADAAAQKAVLIKALARFAKAGSGTYESQVTADGISEPLAHETGSFRLRPVAAQYERAILGIDQASGKPRVQVVRVRSNANTKSYLQLKEWGSWTGCWLRTDLSAITTLTGVEISKSRPLPTAITVLAKARVVDAGGGMDGPHLAVDAYDALQFLGISASAIADVREALSRVAVPVLLNVTSTGSPSGAAIEGIQVADVLSSSTVGLSATVTGVVRKAHAQVVLDQLGTPVDVRAPSSRELLPRHPAATSTCPLNE